MASGLARPPTGRLWKREYAMPCQDEGAALCRLIRPSSMEQSRIGNNQVARRERHVYAVWMVHENGMVQVVYSLYFGTVCVGQHIVQGDSLAMCAGNDAKAAILSRRVAHVIG